MKIFNRRIYSPSFIFNTNTNTYNICIDNICIDNISIDNTIYTDIVSSIEYNILNKEKERKEDRPPKGIFFFPHCQYMYTPYNISIDNTIYTNNISIDNTIYTNNISINNIGIDNIRGRGLLFQRKNNPFFL